MPTKPSDLASTFVGWSGLLILASGNSIIDRIEAQVNSGSGGVGKAITNWVLQLFRNIFNAVVGFLAPGVAGAFAYLQSDPSWMETIASSTANSLWQHRSKILWLWYSYIPDVHHVLNLDIIAGDNEVIRFLENIITALQNYVLNGLSAARSYTDLTHHVLNEDIITGDNNVIRYLGGAIDALETYIVNYQHDVSAEFTRQGNIAHQYTDDSVGSVEHKLVLGLAAVGAAIAALSVFLTTVYVPDAIAAAVAALNLEAAAAMDLEWEFVATTGNKAIADLAIIDVDPTWLTSIMSEIPAVTLASADADMTSALRFAMNFINKAGVPLYRNLKKFGEDTSELDGIITTVLLGAFATAAIADPEDTAAVITTVLGGPLNDILLDVMGLFGL